MKKLIAFTAAASLLYASPCANAMLVIMPEITTHKTVITPQSDNFYDPGAPVEISALYYAGTTGIGKRSLLYLTELDTDANLSQTVSENLDKLSDIDWLANTNAERLSSSETQYDIGVSLNGTYILAGSSGQFDTFDTFSRIDVDEVAIERPMGYVEFSYEFDGVDPVRYYAEVKNLTSAQGAEIKRYSLMKNMELPPGSWPTTVSPENRDEVYDDCIAGLYSTFVNEGMELLPDDSGRVLLPYGEDTFILFIEDTDGRYNALTYTMPIFAETPNVTPAPTPFPLTVFSSDTLVLGIAPSDGAIFNADANGKYTVEIKGKYIEPTMPPVTDIELLYDDSGIMVTINSPDALTNKKLVAAVYDWDEYSDLIDYPMRPEKIRIYDVNTTEVPASKLNAAYHSADIDVSELAYEYVRFMLIDSLENPQPLKKADDISLVLTGLRTPEVELTLSAPYKNGMHTILSWQEPEIDDDGNFSLSYDLDPGQYSISIRSKYNDSYYADFIVNEALE